MVCLKICSSRARRLIHMSNILIYVMSRPSSLLGRQKNLTLDIARKPFGQILSHLPYFGALLTSTI